jgi:SHS2 domain-containing protein
MSYRYLPDIATADVAFHAEGKTLEELFVAAADATTNVMVEDLATIEPKEELHIDLSNDDIDLLLFDFLNELIYLKDARLLLLRPRRVRVSRSSTHLDLQASLYGEAIDREKHSLGRDVKAVTLHRFQIIEHPHGWEATVILDI